MIDRLLGDLLAGPFRRQLGSACRANGWTPHNADEGGAYLRLTAAGQGDHTVFVTHVSGTVAVSAMALAEFLPGRFPPALQAALRRRNDESQPVSWHVIDSATKSYAAARVMFPLAKLDAAALRQSVAVVLPEVDRLNAALRQHGLI